MHIYIVQVLVYIINYKLWVKVFYQKNIDYNFNGNRRHEVSFTVTLYIFLNFKSIYLYEAWLSDLKFENNS